MKINVRLNKSVCVTLTVLLFQTQMAMAQGIQDLHGTNPPQVKNSSNQNTSSNFASQHKGSYEELVKDPDFKDSRSALKKMAEAGALALVVVEGIATIGFYVDYIKNRKVNKTNKLQTEQQYNKIKDELAEIKSQLKKQEGVPIDVYRQDMIKAFEAGKQMSRPQPMSSLLKIVHSNVDEVVAGEKASNIGTKILELGKGSGVVLLFLFAAHLIQASNELPRNQKSRLDGRALSSLNDSEQTQLLLKLLRQVGGEPCELKYRLIEMQESLASIH